MLEKQEKAFDEGKAFPSLFTDLSTLQSQVHMISVQNFIKLTSNFIFTSVSKKQNKYIVYFFGKKCNLGKKGLKGGSLSGLLLFSNFHYYLFLVSYGIALGGSADDTMYETCKYGSES